MILVGTVLPMLLTVLGTCLYEKASNKKNETFGYKMGFALKNETTWKYAQKSCGKSLLKYALVVLIINALIAMTGNVLLLAYLQILFAVGTVIPTFKTEFDLDKTFDTKGNIKLNKVANINEEIKELDKEKEINNPEIEYLNLVKEIITYLANFKNEDLDNISNLLMLLEDEKVLKYFNEYASEEIKERLNIITKLNNKIKIEKPKVFKKSR